MSNQAKVEQLFQFTTKIRQYDRDTFQRVILEEVIKIYDFNAAVYVNIVDYDTLFLSDFIFDAVTFEEDELFEFLNNELYAWHQEEGPYISNFKDYSVVGVPFQNFTWGVFFAEKHPLPTDINALLTFSNSVSIWFDYPHMFYSTEPPVKIDLRSERKYIAMQTLYSIAEWDWDIESNHCVISDAFIAFFDHAKIKESYNITDLHQLIGSENTIRFKECIDKVVRTRYQVFEEFKCPQLDEKTFQHIQMLFDPVYEDGQLTRIIGFCRDNGRTYSSDQYKLHWFDSEWLHDLPVLPLEWIVHSDQECEITSSSFHHNQIKDDATKFLAELTKHLTDLFVKHHYKDSLNICVKFPFSKYHYQLLAAQSNLDPLLWRGFLILIEEKAASSSNNSSLLIQSHEQLLAKQSSQMIQMLQGITDMGAYTNLLQYLAGLSRLSNQAYEFSDFWRQFSQLVSDNLFQVEIKKDLDERVRIPYAQWVLSLFPYIVNHFNLNKFPLKIQITEPAIVESHNARLLEANHVVEISLMTDNGPDYSMFESMLFQFACIGSSMDICFSTNASYWKCRMYLEARSPEQPITINSQKLYEPVKSLQKKTVLIVDDDEYNTQTLEVLFHSDGFRTITANQGQDALRLIDSLDIIDIVILDLRMPVLDGFGVLDELKRNQKIHDLPIMVLSANITPNVSERLRGYNVNAIVEKPFDMDELVGHVNRLIKSPY